MNYYIRIISKNSPPQKYQLEQGENLVGRSRSARIRIKEPDVSGKHFIVRLEGDEISVENLSSKGIYLDDQMLFENSPLRVGQHILAGDALECIIEDDALSQENDERNFSHNFSVDDATPNAVNQAKTASGFDNSAAEETAKSHNNSQTSDSHATDDSFHTDNSAHTNDSVHTDDSAHTDDSGHTDDSAHTDDSGDTTGKSRETAANKTRVATPAEIEYIKEQKKNRVSRLRFVRIILLVLAVCTIAALFLLREDKSAKDAIWPVKSDGSWDTAAVSFEGNGVKNGGFSLFYPRYDSSKTSVSGEKIVVTTSLGQKKLIPLTLSLEFISGSSVLKSDMEECLKNWISTQNRQSGGRWIFEKSSSVQFFGSNNGLPTSLVSYVREADKKTWYGVVRIFRQEDRAYILRAEVPFDSRDRAEVTLRNTSFLLISSKFINEHWEGGVPAVSVDWKTLRRMRNQIKSTSPIRLAGMYRQINGILVDSMLKGDKAKLQIAREMLLSLREVQVNSFNAMKIRYINAVLERNIVAAEKIKAETAAVFSLSNDKRFYDIRTNKW